MGYTERGAGARASWPTIGLSLCAFCATQAVAQDSEDIFELPELIIEGGKSPVDFKDSAASIGVLTSDTILTYGVNDLTESYELFGNVRRFEGNRGDNGFVIRGLNSEGVTESFNNSPLTSVIVAGATQSREATRRGARGIWDVDQVEIYRGPQSTLQGRGALAGAVIVETKDPTFFWEGAGRVTLGEGEREDGAFVISGPVVDDVLAFRLSGERRFSRKGITFNQPANELLGTDEYRNLRAKLLYQPAGNSALRFELTGSDTYDKPGINVSNSADFFDREFNTAPTTAVEFREANNLNVVSEISYVFDNGHELKSITAFIDSETRIFTPESAVFRRVEDRRGEDFTQDLRYSFGEVEDTFSGVVGLFYGRFTLPLTSRVTAGAVLLQDQTLDDSATNLSVYGDVRWRFADDWSLLAGGRFLHEKIREKGSGQFGGTSFSIDSETDFDVFLPKIGLAYDLSADQTITLTAQRGYRSGFIEVLDTGVNRVEPEFLTSYELGYKAVAPDESWRFSASAFYAEYKDQQIVIPVAPPAVSRTLNAGRSRLYGAELEGVYAFDSGFSLFGSLGLLNTKFTDFNIAGGNATGNVFPEAPEITAAIGVNYRAPSGFFAAATASYTDTYFSTGSIQNDPVLLVPSFTNVDLELGYERNDIRAAVFVENLFDRDYVTSLNNNNTFGATPTEATVSEERRIGFEIGVTF